MPVHSRFPPDVLATGDDHVLDSVVDVEVTLGISTSVAAVEPTVANCVGGIGRLLPITLHVLN